MDIGLSYLGASLLSIMDGWIYYVTCKYMLLMLFLFYFVIYIGLGFSLFLGLIAACIYCFKLWNFVAIIASLNVWAM